MINLYDTQLDLRETLGIPKDALVFGRYGGKETFDITFVKQFIANNNYDNIYFLFINTYQFCNKKNVIFFDGTTDMELKRIFINTCDAMLHARIGGETFGLSCGEFASAGKPIITFGKSDDNEHLYILKDKAMIYNNIMELKNIVENFNNLKPDMSENPYKEYLPKNVMNIFKEIYID